MDNSTLAVKLNINEWNYILNLVGQRPITEAMSLFFNMRDQLQKPQTLDQSTSETE